MFGDFFQSMCGNAHTYRFTSINLGFFWIYFERILFGKVIRHSFGNWPIPWRMQLWVDWRGRCQRWNIAGGHSPRGKLVRRGLVFAIHKWSSLEFAVRWMGFFHICRRLVDYDVVDVPFGWLCFNFLIINDHFVCRGAPSSLIYRFSQLQLLSL